MALTPGTNRLSIVSCAIPGSLEYRLFSAG